MGILLKIAGRNIWRSKKRSIILLIAVGIGLWAGIFVMAFYNGMMEQRVNTAIASELSHIQIHHPEFKKDYDMKYHLPQANKMLHEIMRDSLVRAAAARIIVRGMVASAAGSSGSTINGVMPGEEKRLTHLDGKITSGRYLDPQAPNEIIISERLRKKLKLGLNKKIIITFQDKNGDLASLACRVIALYRTNNTPYDEQNVFVKATDMDSLAGIKKEYNEIAVLLRTNRDLDLATTKLATRYPNASIKNWKQTAPELELTISVGNQMVFIFMGIILMALAFGITNTMMMAVLERKREIAMLLALGMNARRVFLMILLETFLLILAGCPLGILMAAISIGITQKTGIDFGRYSEVYSSFGYSSVIYPSLTLTHINVTLALVLCTALLSALLPARRAFTMNTAEALKN